LFNTLPKLVFHKKNKKKRKTFDLRIQKQHIFKRRSGLSTTNVGDFQPPIQSFCSDLLYDLVRPINGVNIDYDQKKPWSRASVYLNCLYDISQRFTLSTTLVSCISLSATLHFSLSNILRFVTLILFILHIYWTHIYRMFSYLQNIEMTVIFFSRKTCTWQIFSFPILQKQMSIYYTGMFSKMFKLVHICV